MKFTKEQISELMCKHAQKESGFHDLLEIMIEGMMVTELTIGLGFVAVKKARITSTPLFAFSC